MPGHFNPASWLLPQSYETFCMNQACLNSVSGSPYVIAGKAGMQEGSHQNLQKVTAENWPQSPKHQGRRWLERRQPALRQSGWVGTGGEAVLLPQHPPGHRQMTPASPFRPACGVPAAGQPGCMVSSCPEHLAPSLNPSPIPGDSRLKLSRG